MLTTPVVLVHDAEGQMLHFIGSGDGVPGWAHYYVQAGYKVYLIDRPGAGRGVFHPDTLGAISPLATYEAQIAEFQRSAKGPNKQWPGTGEIGDPLIDQFMASQNGKPADAAMANAQHNILNTRMSLPPFCCSFIAPSVGAPSSDSSARNVPS